MKILIQYKARITEFGENARLELEMCHINHQIDTETLQTTHLEYTPVNEDK